MYLQITIYKILTLYSCDLEVSNLFYFLKNINLLLLQLIIIYMTIHIVIRKSLKNCMYEMFIEVSN